MTDNRNDAAANVGRGLKNRNVLIAIALAIVALIAVVLMMRGAGDDRVTEAGTEGSTPGYGQPNPAPTTSLPADQGAATAPPATTEGAAPPPAQ